MKIKLFTIPNIITLANLICGALATREVIVNQNYKLAFGFIILAAIFDFCDGLAARLLSQQSAIGVQLDSLADLISFGLAPSFMLFSLCSEGLSEINCQFIKDFLPYATLIVVAFSALRLAKFNIDDTQHTSFVGLPTPANAIFCMSLGMLHQTHGLNIGGEWVVAIAIVMAVLLVAPIRMFSFKSSGEDENFCYYFVSGIILEFVFFGMYAFPISIATYILTSIVKNLSSPPNKVQ
ncbi:MAG: CDP-alcohol phosphatidyltransferase family protein [Rikenellaceae bacterium]